MVDYSKWDAFDSGSDSDVDVAPGLAAAANPASATSAPAAAAAAATLPPPTPPPPSRAPRVAEVDLFHLYRANNVSSFRSRAPDPELVAALARGGQHVTLHRWNGWSIRLVRAPILKNSLLDSTDASHIGWKRELSLTIHAGQHLPEALYGRNSLEVQHESSGLRISFCALEAMRAWALLSAAPIPHLNPNALHHEWDYTFTTNYAGATDMAPLGSNLPRGPDSSSLYPRPATG